MADVGEVKYKVTADDSGIDKQIDGTEHKLRSKFGAAAKSVGMAAGAALAAGAAAVAGIVKQATEAYSEFEQLEGGVKKIFGEETMQTVMDNAANAFKTAGLSANEYMETVTGFSSSLIQSLDGDTAKAAEIADRAIRDMSDNANTFGTSMESIQNAYMGFAKGNFTMLDNLKLGYGGTKEEMARLIEDASKMTDVQEKLGITVEKGNMSFANIANAISIVQEKLGIMGTTENEAATTFQGSLSMMKASWQNLLTGMADPDADIGVLVGNMIDSAQTFLSNAIPIITQSIKGIGRAIKDIAPVLSKEIPGLIKDVVPELLKAGGELIKALGTGILQALPELIPVAVDVIMDLVNYVTDPGTLEALVNGAVDIIIALATGITNALPKLIEKAPEIIITLVTALVKNFPKIIEAGANLLLALIEGVVRIIGKLITLGADLVNKIKEGFSKHKNDAKNWGADLIKNFINGIKERWESLKSVVKGVASSIKSLLGFSVPETGPLHDFDTYAPDMMDLYAKGMRDNIGKVEASAEDVAGTVAGAFTADIGYNLPDIAGYAQDLTASMTASAATEIIIPLTINGREIARASAWFMNEQLAWEARA